ncbi:MAG: glycosyl transferase [Isosphaeraceae bacterium]|jgi:glycosyltransferase involved in cell wall biosynthesis|nr:MAG: glycosyl transferase [Isosphaeraceae bacterium]
MHLLLIHQAFPAQFGELALWLARDRGWRCTVLVESMSTVPPPTEAMLRHVEIRPLAPRVLSDRPLPWPLQYADWLSQCRAVLETLRSQSDLQPDLVVAHGGRGAPTAFIREALIAPIAIYAEYYFAPSHADLSYRLDLPPGDPDVERLFPRCINATTLIALTDADAAYAPTHWQKASFPSRFAAKIDVAFDGIDARLYRPGRASRPYLLAGRTIGPETRLVTFTARGLESIRGYDLFLGLAARIARERSDTLFVVVGADEVHYGWDPVRIRDRSFASWARARHPDLPDDRLVHLGHISPEQLADLLCLSDLHVYLSVPFATSWSLFDALASGAVVLAGDVPPVREVVEPGQHALLAPLFDPETLADAALSVLNDPKSFAPLAQSARQRILENYSLEICLPRLANLFESFVNRAQAR